MGRLAHRPSIARLRIRLALRWMCHRYGHRWDDIHCDPPACRDCGRTRKAHPVTTCTAPNCGKPAVLQWQRQPDQVEADAHVRAGQDTQGNIHGHQQTQATRHAVALRAELDQAAARAAKKDADAARVIPAIHAQLTGAEAALQALQNAGPVIVEIAVKTIAVFACATHAVTVDAATWLHQPTCLTDGTCHCTAP